MIRAISLIWKSGWVYNCAAHPSVVPNPDGGFSNPDLPRRWFFYPDGGFKYKPIGGCQYQQTLSGSKTAERVKASLRPVGGSKPRRWLIVRVHFKFNDDSSARMDTGKNCWTNNYKNPVWDIPVPISYLYCSNLNIDPPSTPKDQTSPFYLLPI
jgi:hypothetical protein